MLRGIIGEGVGIIGDGVCGCHVWLLEVVVMESSPLGGYKAVRVPPCCLRNDYGLITSTT